MNLEESDMIKRIRRTVDIIFYSYQKEENHVYRLRHIKTHMFLFFNGVFLSAALLRAKVNQH
jgi:hypothetical protein